MFTILFLNQKGGYSSAPAPHQPRLPLRSTSTTRTYRSNRRTANMRETGEYFKDIHRKQLL